MKLISITVDPDHASPAMLRQYAQDFGADLSGWAFLFGSQADIAQATRDYFVYNDSALSK